MIGAVVLAAGRGRRFGYAPKMLARLSGRTLVEYALHTLLDTPVRPIIVVTGRRHADVRAAVRGRSAASSRVRVVRNRAYRAGMSGSLRAGLAGLPRQCDAALICLADMPGVSARQIQRLCDAWHAGLDFVRPGSPTSPGHPVLIGRPLFASVASKLKGDRGAQTILDEVATHRAGWLNTKSTGGDIDTPRVLRAHRLHNRVGRVSVSRDQNQGMADARHSSAMSCSSNA